MIELIDIHKTYRMGETEVAAVRGVSLTIRQGEFVALMGPSGSGKSTLMHVLGLLDVPEQGSYRLGRREVATCSEDQLAALRRQTFGFVFQQFNLLPRMNALDNVALPLLYSQHRFDAARAEALLELVGLSERGSHRPSQLSGGQQQRVAIARALINRPRVVLADEPTGNLDSKAAGEIISLLGELNRQGITVILVTHEEELGRQAGRLIRLRDGVIESDQSAAESIAVTEEIAGPQHEEEKRRFWFFDVGQHLRQGFKALAANKIRAGLSMLGILIGVAAVVAMLALGRGAQQAIQEQLAALGSNLLVLRPGAVRIGGVALEAGVVTRITNEDAAALREAVPGIKEASPVVVGRGQAAYGGRNWSTQVLGAGPAYARMRSAEPRSGRFFSADENRQRRRVAVIGATVVRQIFGEQNPIGETVKINKISFHVIGLLPERGATGWRDQDDVIVIPLFTAMHRLLGKDYVDYIDIEAESAEATSAVQQGALALMHSRHRVPLSQQQDAFEVRNMSDIQAAWAESSRTMGFLLAAIAAVSLLVGGIGIMNIMLVSVTERTREIGLRKAIGARRSDILFQFVSEAVVVSVAGGVLGIAAGWGITRLLAHFAGWATAISPGSIALAFLFSAGVGMVFGLYPAYKAARLNPIDALRHE